MDKAKTARPAKIESPNNMKLFLLLLSIFLSTFVKFIAKFKP